MFSLNKDISTNCRKLSERSLKFFVCFESISSSTKILFPVVELEGIYGECNDENSARNFHRFTKRDHCIGARLLSTRLPKCKIFSYAWRRPHILIRMQFFYLVEAKKKKKKRNTEATISGGGVRRISSSRGKHSPDSFVRIGHWLCFFLVKFSTHSRRCVFSSRRRETREKRRWN